MRAESWPCLNYHGSGVLRRNEFVDGPVERPRLNRSRIVGILTVVVCLMGHVAVVRAQGIEITPIGGYRFGGDFFEIITAQPVDLDGAPAIGVVVNVPGSE